MHSAPRGARDTPRTRAAPQVVHTAENTYIVMELLSGGELFNRLAALAESAPLPGREGRMSPPGGCPSCAGCPSEPAARPRQRGSWPWPQQAASGRSMIRQ